MTRIVELKVESLKLQGHILYYYLFIFWEQVYSINCDDRKKKNTTCIPSPVTTPAYKKLMLSQCFVIHNITKHNVILYTTCTIIVYVILTFMDLIIKIHLLKFFLYHFWMGHRRRDNMVGGTTYAISAYHH